MRFGGRRISNNVGMQTGRGGGGFGFPMGGGGRFPMGGGGMGCGGIVILLILAVVFGINPMSLLGTAAVRWRAAAGRSKGPTRSRPAT